MYAERLAAGAAIESSPREHPWGIAIENDAARRRVVRDGIVGLGEAYEAGHWRAARLDEVMHRVFTSPPPRLSATVWLRLAASALDQRLFNRQSGRGAFNIGVKHYDLGNDLFRCMLDESMTYTSGYWQGAETLADAQTAKLDLLCRKLDIQPGDRVLDIGCGWGNFARYAAERYGAHVTGLTVSNEQAELARQRCGDLPVEIRLQDYREVDETFDHVVSIEMIEAVGARNVPTYFRAVDRCLREGGRFALQVISGDMLSQTSDRGMDQFCLWLLKYIFPDGYLPRESQLVPPRDTGMAIQDWHRFGDDYERTLMAWADNFDTGWEAISDQYDDRFRRRWEFYLYGCAAAFRAELIHVSQIVYSKGRSSARCEPVR